MKSYARFYPKFFDRLQQAQAFSSREDAVQCMREIWLQIHREAGASQRRLRIMQSARICAEQGWHDIDQEVCYLNSPDDPPVRLYVHRDGTVIVQQMGSSISPILLAKPGIRAMTAS